MFRLKCHIATFPSNLLYIGAWLLIPFCSFISHTVLPIPPTVILFLGSFFIMLCYIAKKDFKIVRLNWVSVFPLFLSLYLLMFQSLLNVDIRSLTSPFLAPVYFIVALLYLSILDEKKICRFVNLFIYVSIFIFAIECVWRISHPSLPEGVTDISTLKSYRWFYVYKGRGLMYAETNSLAIHIVIVYFFTLWWGTFKKKKMLIIKMLMLLFLFLSFSRAAIFSVAIGLFYKYCYSRMSINNKFSFWVIISVPILIAIPAYAIPALETDPGMREKFTVFAEIIEYYKDIDLMPFLIGIGNYNSKEVFSIYAHNYILVFLIEMGFVGLMLLMLQFGVFIRKSKGAFLFVFIPFFVQVMSSTTIFIPHLYIIAAIMIYYSNYQYHPKSNRMNSCTRVSNLNS